MLGVYSFSSISQNSRICNFPMGGHFILSNFKKNDEKLEKIELDKSVSDTSIDNVDDSLNKLAATIEDSFPSEDEKAQAVDYFSEKI